MPQQSRQADRTAVDERHAPSPAVDPENRVPRRDSQIAPESELEAAGHGVPLDRGQGGFGEQHPRGTHRTVSIQSNAVAPSLADSLEIGSCAEHASGAGQHRDGEVVIGVETSEGIRQLRRRGSVDGVAHLRTIDRDDGDGALGFKAYLSHGELLHRWVPEELELLTERAKVQLQGPGASLLDVETPEGRGDRVDAQHPVLPLLLLELGETLVQLVAIDHAVDDDVTDVKTLGPELTGHAVGDGAEPGLRRRERGEGGPRTNRGRGAGKQQRAAAARKHATGGLAADQESTEATQTPHVFEERVVHFEQRLEAVVAGVVHDELRRTFALFRGIEKSHDIGGNRRVGDHRCRPPPGRLDLGSRRLDPRLRTTGEEHVQTFFAEAAAQGGSEPRAGSDPDHDCDASHGLRSHLHNAIQLPEFVSII